MMAADHSALLMDGVVALYLELLENGVRYFLPDSHLQVAGPDPEGSLDFELSLRHDGSLQLSWFGQRYVLRRAVGAFGMEEIRLLSAVGATLRARYELLRSPGAAAGGMKLLRGIPEDRVVSAYLDPELYEDPGRAAAGDRVADALETLRVISLSTYENRRISTGVLLVGADPDASHPEVPAPDRALRFDAALTAIKSFARLSDGVDTLLLVDRQGKLVDLTDVRDWSRPYADLSLPAPAGGVYRDHCLATVRGGHICLVLTPNGEIKVFAGGAQLFNYLGGRWRLTESEEKYVAWRQAIGDPRLAEILFTASLNLTEKRKGGLFVVVETPEDGDAILQPRDRLRKEAPVTDSVDKTQIHYLLRGKTVFELPPNVLETIASMDGAILLDRQGQLLSFGAILQHDRDSFSPAVRVEGGRTTAAVSASRAGLVLKISEDGIVSFFRAGRQVWEM